MALPLLNKLFGGEEQEPTALEEAEGQDLVGKEAEGEEEGQLAVDVYQDKDNVIIKSTIAGVKPEDLDITIADNMIAIKGERRRWEEVKKEDYFYQECYYGSFSRSLMLPVEVDVDKARADLREGILTVVLPKASRAKTRKVKVKTEE